jgi:hypothetical protein
MLQDGGMTLPAMIAVRTGFRSSTREMRPTICLTMRRIYSEDVEFELPEDWVSGGSLLRREPDDEEDEEQGERKKQEDDDEETEDGYSE